MPTCSPTRRTRRAALAAVAALTLPATVVAASASTAHADPFEGGKKVPRSSITSDPAVNSTGSQQLVDGTGVKYYANSDITFSTSSSASGGMSEASFTASHEATTANGGTVVSTLNDAFDGYNTLATFVGPSAPNGPIDVSDDQADPNLAIYNKLGASPTSSCGGREEDFPVQTVGQVGVSRSVYVPAAAGQGYARWVNTVTNHGATATEVHLYVDNNLGSDSNTKIFGSSSGDAAASTADTWVGTFQNYTGGGTSSDPRLGHVLRGAGDTSATEISFTDGDDNPFWDYALNLAPGETKSIVNYVVAANSKADAATRAADLAAHPSFTCLSDAQVAQVANFDTVAPTLHVPTAISVPATDSRGARVTFSATATDATDTSPSVTCTPPSGSVFPVGTTTVTCTATDSAGNVATRSFKVTVAPYGKLAISRLRLRPSLVALGGQGVLRFKLSSAADVRLKFMTRDRKPVFLEVQGKKGRNKVVFGDTVSGVDLSHRYYLLIVTARDDHHHKDKAKTHFRFDR
jgi:hypothetical protein